MGGAGWHEQDGVVRGWQVGAVGACVVGVMALFGQAAWAQVVTPQPWPGVVGDPIVVGAAQRPADATKPGAQTVGPALDPTAAATSTVLPTDPSGAASAVGAEPTSASTFDVAGAPVRVPGEQPTTAPQNTANPPTTVTSAPRVVTPDRVRELDAEDETETKSATSQETRDSHESDKDDD